MPVVAWGLEKLPLHRQSEKMFPAAITLLTVLVCRIQRSVLAQRGPSGLSQGSCVTHE